MELLEEITELLDKAKQIENSKEIVENRMAHIYLCNAIDDLENTLTYIKESKC